ncbi:hypothetical protein GCM10010387_03050 [Streptomyces inusitatus]|uniref:Uncharacterized protein n=1 Tax=Streptomyces inusitatus TaxID=68221 RepID=A0A918PLJ9_9ACTN|nr:hypothetical protein [Streptomyces inusitatus]GGZ14336.1 hypothetical protein GCM10010387_03050 [Streptomyces inusitatus]
MSNPDPHEMWADAHVSYSLPAGPGSTRRSDPLSEQTAAWNTRLTETAPHGGLLADNAMFQSLRDGNTLHLLHVTQSFDRIARHGSLRPSGGCLVGSLYCAPLTPTSGGLRMHNLAEYVLTREAPAAATRSPLPGRVTTPLVLEVAMPRHGYRGLTGIDYLRLGSIHLRNYRERENLLGPKERCELQETVVSRVRNSMDFLSLAAAIAHSPEPAEHKAFPRLLSETIPRLPILGYVYFEALSEYLMLYSRSRHTQRLADLGEFNNWLYKKFLFQGFSDTAGHFDLAGFRPGFARLEQLLNQVDPSIEATHARAHLTARISYLATVRFLEPEQITGQWHHIRWDFNHVAESFGPLLGHLIHRELRRFHRYPDFYHFFDAHKAAQAWNYWNHMGIALPFNGTIPKGEIGVNPAYSELEYRVWRAELGDDGLLHPAEEVALRLTPRLVDTRHTVMRDRQARGRNDTPMGDRRLADTLL